MAKKKIRPLTPDIRGFIKSFTYDVASGTAAIFAGAGLSVASGYVNWSDLLRDIAEELDLDVDRETNLVAIAQYHFNERRNRSRLNQKLVDEFSAGHAVNENHKILARLPIDTYWTTNYDRMIETALEAAKKIVDSKHTVNDLKKVVRGRDVVVYKMHGDVSDPENAVLTKDDYEGYFRDREPYVTALSGDLVSKTMLFIGFSFTDPNIDYVLSRIRVALRQRPKQHYCILRNQVRGATESKANFEYRKRQHSYFVKDLARIGIQALMVDEYADVTEILKAIERGYRRRTVFLGGSAHDFGRWRSDQAAQMVEALSAGLVAMGLTVLTGFGLGVGPSVIAGAMREIKTHPGRRSPAQLQAFPFPIDDGSAPGRRALYRSHREDMLAKAGIAIFLFGNKRDGTKVVPADGVREEFEIAKTMGIDVVAVGCTGWVAEEISTELAKDLGGRSAAFRKAFNTANKNLTEAAAAALKMVKEIASN